MARDPLACDSCPVREIAACAALSAEERDELARLGHHLTLKRGETLSAAGGENRLSTTLISGVLKVSSYDQDGTERILSLIHPAGFAGELFTPAVHHDIVALTNSELCVFPRREYEEAIERFPALGRALLRRSSDDLLDSRSLLAAVTGRTAIRRVASFLLALARAASPHAGHAVRRFELVLTRGEIAGLLGLTIETVSRQLTRLDRDGIIRRDGARGICVEDPEGLARLAS
jgi:CRP/FNR family transcriptional regulator, anaerobic regulatory protein